MARIPLACPDFSFPLLPHELALDLIAGMGFDGVDISLIRGNSHLQLEEVLANPSAWGDEVHKRVKRRGLNVADINYTPGLDLKDHALNHPDAKAQEEGADWFRRALEFACQCGARNMTLLPGIEWDGEEKKSSFQRTVDGLGWRVEAARMAGVRLSVEPHLGSIVPTPGEAKALLREVPGLRVTLDYGHFVYQGIPESECESLLPDASHFHGRGGCVGRLQAPRKQNTINFPRVLQKMKEVGYRGYFAVEYVWIEWEHCNEVDIVSETIMLRDIANQFR